MIKRFGFWLGAAGFALLQWLPAPAGLEPAAWHVASVAALMGIW